MTNKSITATEAKNRFSDMVDLARTEPVTITRNDRPVAIVLSPAEYSRLVASDDQYWGQLAQNATPDNFLTTAESQSFLTTLLNATDSAT